MSAPEMNGSGRSAVEKISLGFLPTPLEPMPRFSAWLGGPEIWIKRDDCTGLGGGGNKTRKLEYLMADALRLGADIVLTAGALQSNHARQTAAAAARLGLDCLLVLSDAVPGRASSYFSNGNLVLDTLFGAEIERVPPGGDGAAVVEARMEALRAAGRRPYFIPTGGSNWLGALAYADAVGEVMQQAGPEGGFDRIIVGSGSGGTQAGIAAGCFLHGCGALTQGISVAQTETALIEVVGGIIDELGSRIGAEMPPRNTLRVDDTQVGDGYGQPSAAMLDAVRHLARLEGILLDPVYTGKAMAGLIDGVRSGRYGRDEKILFWHTGGSQGLFAYPELFAN